MSEAILLAASLLVLLALNFLLVVTRASFSETSHARLLALREHRGKQVNRTSLLLNRGPRLFASLSLLLAVVRFLEAGWVVWALFRSRLVVSSGFQEVISSQIILPVFLLVFVALMIAALLLFWFEKLVIRWVSPNSEVWILRLTPLARLFMWVSYPFLIPMALSDQLPGGSAAAGLVTEDELRTLVDAGQEEGVFEKGERQMIYSIIELGDTLAREIMVPRIDMLVLDVNTSLDLAVDALLQSGHSRVPVYEDTVDHTLGLLYAKDLLRVWREGDRNASLRELLRPAYFVPEAKKVDELLAEMQSQRIHMAIVVDEYGGVAGLVTLEDIVEEILGEIQDEYDQAEELPYQALKNGEYLFRGRVDLNDFNEIMGSNLLKDEADTLGGYIYSRLGRVPGVGETVRKDNLVLTVEQVSARRIRKVRARWVDAEEDSGEKTNVAEG